MAPKTKRTLKVVLGILIAVVVVAVMIDPPKRERDRSNEPTSAPVAVPATVTPAPDASTPDAATAVTAATLPDRHVDVHDILGRSHKDVEKLVGKDTPMEDGQSGFVVGSPPKAVLLMVSFSAERAVSVFVVPQTAIDKVALKTWAGIRDADDAESAWSSDGSVQVWAPGEQARMVARAKTAIAFTRLMETSGAAGATASAGAGTRLTITPAPGDRTCNKASLAKIMNTLRSISPNLDLKRDGFDTVQCGPDGDVLKL